MARKPKRRKAKTGPKPERVKINQSWEDAITHAIHRPRPSGGWPKLTRPTTPPRKRLPPA